MRNQWSMVTISPVKILIALAITKTHHTNFVPRRDLQHNGKHGAENVFQKRLFRCYK